MLLAAASLARCSFRTEPSLRSFAAAAAASIAGGSSSGGAKKKKRQSKSSSSSSSPPLPHPPALPVVVLLGRPNVGKSALFNRLTGSRQALVRDTPGSHVTRDWRSSKAGKLGDLRFEIVDTSGLEEQKVKKASSSSSSAAASALLDSSSSSLGSRVASLTADLLTRRADVALLLLDAKDGITPADEALARWLRRRPGLVTAIASSSSSDSSPASPDFHHLDSSRRPPAPIVVAVNKAEAARSNPRVAAAVAEAGSLGFGEGVGVSAETGEGLAELYAALAPTLDRAAERLMQEMEESEEVEGEEEFEGGGEEGEQQPMRVALVGAPNAGKSTLSNALLGSERSLTGPEPGLTRDAVWATLEWRSPPPAGSPSSSSREKRKKTEEEEQGEGEEAETSSSTPSPPPPRQRARIVELIDTAGWDRRTARTASIGNNDGGSGDNGGEGGGKALSSSTAASSTASSSSSSSSLSSSSSSPASTLLAPADVIAEAMRQTERGINLAHVAVVVVDLAAAAARADASSLSSAIEQQQGGGEAAATATAAAAARARRKKNNSNNDDFDSDAAAPQILTRTELALASRAAEAGRAVVFVGAKADLLLGSKNSSSSSLEKSPAVAAAARALALDVSRRLPQLAGAPVLALSAATGAGMHRLLPAVAAAHAAWDGRVPTSALNRWLEGAKKKGGSLDTASSPSPSSPSSSRGGLDAAARSLARIRYLTQASTRPPSFVAFARGGTSRGSGGGGGGGGGGNVKGKKNSSQSSQSSRAEAAARRAADERLEKMLCNRLRAEFGMRGVPIRVAVRGSASSTAGGGGGKADYRRRN